MDLFGQQRIQIYVWEVVFTCKMIYGAFRAWDSLVAMTRTILALRMAADPRRNDTTYTKKRLGLQAGSLVVVIVGHEGGGSHFSWS